MNRESPSERAARQSRVSAERRPERIDALKRDIREELNQSAAWWKREYGKAITEHYVQKPFNPDEHDGHELIDLSTYMHGTRSICAECAPEYIPKGASK